MNSTKFAVFSLMIVAIISQMSMYAAWNTSGANRTSSQSSNPSVRKYGRGKRRPKHIEGRRGYGPCKGDTCPTAGEKSASYNSDSDNE